MTSGQRAQRGLVVRDRLAGWSQRARRLAIVTVPVVASLCLVALAGLPPVSRGPATGAGPVALQAQLASYQTATVNGTVTVSPSWAYPGSEDKASQDFACTGSADIVDVRVEGTDISSPVTNT